MTSDDVRECMIGAVAIRLKDPMFESQTKNKLGNTEIRTELVNTVREELLHFFNRNKDIATKIVEPAVEGPQESLRLMLRVTAESLR